MEMPKGKGSRGRTAQVEMVRVTEQSVGCLLGRREEGLSNQCKRWKLGIGERGGWLGREQLAANLISSCDRDGQGWPEPTAGMKPGPAGTSSPVTRDVFIKSKGKVITIQGGWQEGVCVGPFGGGRGEPGPRSMWSLANLSSALPQLDQLTIQPVFTENHMV